MLIGSIEPDTLVGIGGDDTICGSLGVDTVDYSDSPAGVRVSTANAATSRRMRAISCPWSGVEPGPDRAARIDCLPELPADAGQEGLHSQRRDPGVEQDCVGEDIENIIGSEFDDVLIGNSPDPYEGRSPRVEPHGLNRIEGGGGNDLIDGLFGPDALSGGDGSRHGGLRVTRTKPVFAAIDGAPNDGTDFQIPHELEHVRSLGTPGSCARYSCAVTTTRARTSPTPSKATSRTSSATAHDDLLRGDGDANVLEGGDGNDFVDGGGGGDSIEAGNGHDAAVGGERQRPAARARDGNDQLDGENDNDNVRGEGGDDVVAGGAGADGLERGRRRRHARLLGCHAGRECDARRRERRRSGGEGDTAGRTSRWCGAASATTISSASDNSERLKAATVTTTSRAAAAPTR